MFLRLIIVFLLFVPPPTMILFIFDQVDEELNPLPVNVRVGQAVETVGQAGKPKTITGFQTHTTPILLGVRDRAEVCVMYCDDHEVFHGGCYLPQMVPVASR